MKRTATFKMIAREYHNYINVNIREYQNQNDCEDLSQSKGIPGSITIKMIVRMYDLTLALSTVVSVKTSSLPLHSIKPWVIC